MSDFSKDRWQKLAGILKEDVNMHKHKLNATDDDEGAMAKGQLEKLVSQGQKIMDLLPNDAHLEAWVQSKITTAAEFIDTVAHYLLDDDSSLEEAQFAKDALEDVDTMWQPGRDEDYTPNPKTPKMVGSAMDDEFSLDDFNPEDEGLSVRSAEDEELEEGKKGLWHNIQAKRKRGEPPAKPGDEDYPDRKAWKKAQEKD